MVIWSAAELLRVFGDTDQKFVFLTLQEPHKGI